MMHIALAGKEEPDESLLARNLFYVSDQLWMRKQRIGEIQEHRILDANDLWPRRALSRVTAIKADN